MIANERVYQENKEMLRGWQENLKEQQAQWRAEGRTEEEIETMSQLVSYWPLKIKADVEEYEAIKRGDFNKTCTWENIGKQLIRFRIWKGYSQTQLAEKLGVSVQQVWRDERNEYYKANSEKIRQVLEALEVECTIPVIPKASSE